MPYDSNFAKYIMDEKQRIQNTEVDKEAETRRYAAEKALAAEEEARRSEEQEARRAKEKALQEEEARKRLEEYEANVILVEDAQEKALIRLDVAQDEMKTIEEETKEIEEEVVIIREKAKAAIQEVINAEEEVVIIQEKAKAAMQEVINAEEEVNYAQGLLKEVKQAVDEDNIVSRRLTPPTQPRTIPNTELPSVSPNPNQSITAQNLTQQNQATIIRPPQPPPPPPQNQTQQKRTPPPFVPPPPTTAQNRIQTNPTERPFLASILNHNLKTITPVEKRVPVESESNNTIFNGTLVDQAQKLAAQRARTENYLKQRAAEHIILEKLEKIAKEQEQSSKEQEQEQSSKEQQSLFNALQKIRNDVGSDSESDSGFDSDYSDSDYPDIITPATAARNQIRYNEFIKKVNEPKVDNSYGDNPNDSNYTTDNEEVPIYKNHNTRSQSAQINSVTQNQTPTSRSTTSPKINTTTQNLTTPTTPAAQSAADNELRVNSLATTEGKEIANSDAVNIPEVSEDEESGNESISESNVEYESEKEDEAGSNPLKFDNKEEAKSFFTSMTNMASKFWQRS
jgi:hypothetical protein